MYLYLAPHLDDAVLSAGGLIQRQTVAGHAVCVVTFCTADPGQEISDLARRVHEKWGNPKAPFAGRRIEDIAACTALGAQWRHVGLLDAIYRRNPSVSPFEYTSFDELFGAIPAWDAAQTAAIQQAISALSEWRPTAIYAPLGVGRNVDHLHVVDALWHLQAELTQPLWLYEDQPYVAGIYPRGVIDPVGAAIKASRRQLLPEVHAIDFGKKRSAIRCYRSQLEELFGANLDGLDALEAYSRSLSGDGAAGERVWRVA